MSRARLFPLALLPLLAACNGAGIVEVTAYGEEYVEDRIPAADTIDGWAIVFDRFEVNVLDIAAQTADHREAGYFLDAARVDLTGNTSGAGHALATGDIATDADHLHFTVAPHDDAPAIVVEGRATRGDDEKTFAWSFDTTTRYLCVPDAFPVTDGARVPAQLTMHADHLFYDDFDVEEPNVAFDLIASADMDGDDVVTEEELRATDITGELHYQVGSRDIDELWSFIAAQTRTLGHIDGEAHCDAE